MKFGTRELVFVLLLFAVPSSVYFLIFKPRKEAEVRMIQESRDRQEKLEDLNRARAIASRNLRDHIDMLRQLLKIVRSRQPGEEDATRILHGLDMLANSNRLQAETTTNTAGGSSRSRRGRNSRQASVLGGPGKRYVVKRIRMTVQGAYFDFYAFLQALENQPRIIRVTRMTINKLKRDQQQGHIRAIMDLEIFFKRKRAQS